MSTNMARMGVRSREKLEGFLLAAWIVTMVVFSIPPIINLFTPGYEQKDYEIWYRTGQMVIAGGDIYEQGVHRYFPFMYPPPAAVVLAPLTVFGELPFYIFLEVINSAAWITCVFLSVYLVTGRATRQSTWLYVVPIVCCVSYVWDTYLLGQPNIVLLACLLGAFVFLRRKQEGRAGALIAFAAATKAFPVMALGYLVYRRHWKASASMLVSLAFFLLLFPAPIRGFHQNLQDLKTWTNGMLLKYDQGTIAQRPDVSYHWKNQSLIATANRLLREVPADWIKDTDGIVRPLHVNFAELDFRTINMVILGSALALCLFYIASMPRKRDRTAESDTVEYAMLLILITIFSPLSWFYYGVWLILPFTVVTNFILKAPRSSIERTVAIAWLGVSLFLLNFVFPVSWIRPIRGVGITFFGCISFLGELGWILWCERRRAKAGAESPSLEKMTLRPLAAGAASRTIRPKVAA